jgi:outer membrane protein assembly factor BamB
LAALGLLAALTAASAADWPRFRGPNGTGTAADANIPVTFAEGDGILWKVPISGAGNSSPVVARGKLFLQSASADGRERALLCLDAATGSTVWTALMPGRKAPTHKKNSLASSTPAVDGERVYTCFWDGADVVLAAYDLQGSLRWKQGLGRYISQHGFGASPVVDDGRVFVNFDQDWIDEKGNKIAGNEHATAVFAFDAASGSPLWRQEREPYRACYSSPLVRESAAGGKELVVATSTATTAYDPKSGAVLWTFVPDWSYKDRPLRVVGSPVVWKDAIVVTYGDGSGDSRIIAHSVGKPGVTSQLLWEHRKGFPYVPTLLVHGDHVYTVTDRGGVAGCYDAKTGKERWNERLGGNVSASPVLIDGKVYAPNEEGVVFVYAAAPAFKLLGRNPLGEHFIATPAVADGRLYIRGDNHLFCVGAKK